MPDTMASRPTFLICINDAIVAEDVAGILQDAMPQSSVICAASQADALQRLETLHAPLIGFIQMAPEAVADSPLGQALTQAGARIVLLGNAAEERGEAAGFAVLQRPFRSVDLLALVDA